MVLAGHGKFATGDQTIDVEAGDVIWWAPGQDHELLEASDTFRMGVIGVTPAFSERVLGGSQRVSSVRRVQLSAPAFAKLRDACNVPLVQQDATAFEVRVGDLWHDAHELRARSANVHPLASRAIERLAGAPKLGRADVAAALRAHPSDVSRHFHRSFGLTLNEYRTRLRLLRFIAAVDREGVNLLFAAGLAGFGSYSQCHRAFRATLGCTPRDFFAGQRHEIENALTPW